MKRFPVLNPRECLWRKALPELLEGTEGTVLSVHILGCRIGGVNGEHYQNFKHWDSLNPQLFVIDVTDVFYRKLYCAIIQSSMVRVSGLTFTPAFTTFRPSVR